MIKCQELFLSGGKEKRSEEGFITKQKIFLPQVVRVGERARTKMVQVYKPPPGTLLAYKNNLNYFQKKLDTLGALWHYIHITKEMKT